MEKTGYVKIYRIILENPIIKKPVYAWLWTVLLLKANHKETKMIWNGKVIIIKGSCSLKNCHCSDGYHLTIIMPRTKKGIVEGIHVEFKDKNEFMEVLK